MEENNLPTTSMHPISVANLKANIQAIQQAMRDVMREGIHYGTIPGTDGLALLKPGADKIAAMFRLIPDFKDEVILLPNDHREIRVKTYLSLPSGEVVGCGVGSCSTMEKKYRWRSASKKCPACGKEAIIRGKKDFGGGWLCFAKKGGCGMKWFDGDMVIEDQAVGQVENPDIADIHNTVLKMAKKRSFVDAVITATAASDIFNQDIEEMNHEDPEADPRPGFDEIRAKPLERSDLILDWNEYKYRYHLPVKKAGWNMEALRKDIKARGARFNEEDKHWYSNTEYPSIADYLRPLSSEPLIDANGAIDFGDALITKEGATT